MVVPSIPNHTRNFTRCFETLLQINEWKNTLITTLLCSLRSHSAQYSEHPICNSHLPLFHRFTDQRAHSYSAIFEICVIPSDLEKLSLRNPLSKLVIIAACR